MIRLCAFVRFASLAAALVLGTLTANAAITGSISIPQAVQAGEILYLSAQCGKPGSDFSQETRQALENVSTILSAAHGDDGVRGFLAAFDFTTGKLAWRLWTIPGPGEPGPRVGRAIATFTAAAQHGCPAPMM